MPLFKSLLTIFTICALTLAARAQTTPVIAEDPFALSATADPATVHPGDSLKFTVSIKNVTKDPQTIDIPNIVWAAATDTPQVLIPGWPARGGIGPVVTFKATTIAPGGSFDHTWTANVVPAAARGDLTLRVGVPLKRGGDKTWSKPLTLHIVAPDAPNDITRGPLPVGAVHNVALDGTNAATTAPKDAPKETVPNPLYAAWKNQEGKTTSYTRTTQITGGVPGNPAPPTSSPLMLIAKEITPDHATISFDYARNALPETLTIPAATAPEDPACPKPAGKETLTLNSKTYSCTKYTYTTTAKTEIGRDPQGLRAQVTVWLAEGVPGGIVQRKISLTIRASYDITDTLSPK